MHTQRSYHERNRHDFRYVLIFVVGVLLAKMAGAQAPAASTVGPTPTVHITHLDGRLRSVEISDGQPSATLSRAKILALANATEGYLLHDQAAAYLQQQARDAPISRWQTIGQDTISFCSSAAGFGLGRIKSASAKAGWAAAGTVVGSIICSLWQSGHQRISADASAAQTGAQKNIDKLVSDAGAELDRYGAWSGLLVVGQ